MNVQLRFVKIRRPLCSFIQLMYDYGADFNSKMLICSRDARNTTFLL